MCAKRSITYLHIYSFAIFIFRNLSSKSLTSKIRIRVTSSQCIKSNRNTSILIILGRCALDHLPNRFFNSTLIVCKFVKTHTHTSLTVGTYCRLVSNVHLILQYTKYINISLILHAIDSVDLIELTENGKSQNQKVEPTYLSRSTGFRTAIPSNPVQ